MRQPPAGNAGAILAALERDGERPLRAMIEIADRCNEVCVHCYQEQGHKGEMTTAELERVIDELAEMGVLILTISGGEATLRKDFLHVMRHARKRGFVLRLFTNGLTMTRELAQALFELAVDVVEISLYSHRADVHDFVTGVPGAFERTVAGIRHLVQVGVSTHVKTPVMRVNEDELDAYVAFVTSLGVSYAFDHQVLSPRENGSLEPSALDRSEAAARALLDDPRFGASRALPPPPSPTRSLCGAGESIMVEPNGDLRPCVVLPMSFGNALETGGIRASRQSAVRRELGALRWRDVHGCRDCDLQAYCHRCHAQSLAEAGDALAPYRSACAGARSRYGRLHGAEPSAPAERELGPYRLHEGVLRARPHRIEPRDDALAARLGWVRSAPATPAASGAVQPGALVQLRRPGRKGARLERVPDRRGEDHGVIDAAE